MAKIILHTKINAPINKVFDINRDIDVHKSSTSKSKETAIDGVIKGLINTNETVTWQAKHLFKTRQFTSKITAMQAPVHFIDEMIKGDFKSFRHEHHFKAIDNGTIMIDHIDFESPYGLIGQLFNKYYVFVTLS